MATNISHWLKVQSRWFKNYICAKMCISFCIAFIIPSDFINIIAPNFALWMLDFFNTIWVLNSLDTDQAGHFVGSDLGPNCLQRLSADKKKGASSRQRVKYITTC